MQKIDFNKANIINHCNKFLLALSSYIFAKTAPIKTKESSITMIILHQSKRNYAG